MSLLVSVALTLSGLMAFASPAQAAVNTYTYSGPAVAIPDNNPAGATAAINVPAAPGEAVEKVTVRIGSITHPYDGDLSLYLIGPNNTTVELSSGNGGSGDNYTATVFDDAAATSITAGSAPFTGTFRPEGSLAALNGITPGGAWTLKMVDSGAADVGSLAANGWSITLTTGTPSPPGVPGTPTAVAGAGQATVSFTAPVTGGAATSYRVTATPGGQSCVAVAPTLQCVVTGLGGTYQFSVTASNALGTSDPSPLSTAVTVTAANSQVVLNSSGGNGAGDGLRVTYQAGQIQVHRAGAGQLYSPTQLPSASGTMYNSIMLAVGDSSSTGVLFRNMGSGGTAPTGMTFSPWTTVQTTGGSTGSGSFTSVLTGTAFSRTYTVTVTGTYTANNDYLTLSYSVTVPAGNTKSVRLFNAYDSYLTGNDEGPGFYTPSVSGSPSVVGVTRDGLIEALRHRSGATWSSYTSQVYTNAIGNPGQLVGPGFGSNYTNIIDESPTVDNGFGVSWDFGSSEGTYTTASDLVIGTGAIAGAPGAPTDVTATAGAGSALVTWTPPVDTGTTPITGYEVTAAPGGQSCVANAPSTSCSVPGLTAGTPYTFTVTAINGSGAGPASAPSNSVTPTAPPVAPGIPGQPTAVAGDGSVTVTISPPSSGGTPTSYTVTAVGGAGSCTITVPDTSCVVSPLTNGTAYTFTSTATNGGGTSSASIASAPVTPNAPALTPTFGPVTRTVGGFTTQLTNFDPAFSWAGTATAGGSVTIDGSGLVTVTGVSANVESIATITTSRTGYADGSGTVSGTSLGLAAAPTGLASTPGPATASIAFTPPVSDGGSAITNYQYSIDGGSNWVTRSPAAATSPLLITGLANGTTYTVLLRAINEVGAGASSTGVTVRPQAIPTPPTSPAIASGTLSWSAPGWTASPTVTGYAVFYKKWADRANTKVKWGIYAMKNPGGWPAGTAPTSVRLNATRNACGAENLAAGFNYCPLPYGNLTDPDGYAIVTLAQTGTTLGQYSPVVRYVP